MGSMTDNRSLSVYLFSVRYHPVLGQLIRKLIRQGDLESENVATLLENVLEGNVLMWSVLWWTVKSPSNTPCSSLSVSYQSYPSLRVLAVSLIHSHNTSNEGDLTPRVLALLLNRNLLASVVVTTVYPQLIESALSGNKSPTIDQLVDQLLSAGCEPEASMLRSFTWVYPLHSPHSMLHWPLSEANDATLEHRRFTFRNTQWDRIKTGRHTTI
uniref:Uncharacterized protein n=1 Tax=Timema douglasi TaxID=61478 RepID=A0A7R8ZG92_TIMDO|nr:unnamed protein product [Timema douglasi]